MGREGGLGGRFWSGFLAINFRVKKMITREMMNSGSTLCSSMLV